MIKLKNSYRIAYDELTDTLYLSIGEPKKATESYLDEDYVLVRKEYDAITGITIDGFLERHDHGSWRRTCLDVILSFQHFPLPSRPPANKLRAMRKTH